MAAYPALHARAKCAGLEGADCSCSRASVLSISPSIFWKRIGICKRVRVRFGACANRSAPRSPAPRALFAILLRGGASGMEVEDEYRNSPNGFSFSAPIPPNRVRGLAMRLRTRWAPPSPLFRGGNASAGLFGLSPLPIPIPLPNLRGGPVRSGAGSGAGRERGVSGSASIAPSGSERREVRQQ